MLKYSLYQREWYEKKKQKVGRRCVDCGKLKSFKGERCGVCSGKRRYKLYGMPRPKSLSHKNEENGNWKGEGAGYGAIHTWLRRHYVLDKCEFCGKIGECKFCGTKNRLDFANKNGIYNRERKNWLILCRKCHIKYDMSRL